MTARSVRDFGTLTYEKCLNYLRSRDSCHLGHNTSLTRGEGGVVYVVYHRTRIIAFHEDGAVILDCAGYRTNTTKDRLNYLTNAHVCQKKFVWYVGLLPYYDGINVGTPRNERESLEQAAMYGDRLAFQALRDYDNDHPAA